MLLPERDCGTCNAAQKQNWGCAEDAPIPLLIDGENVFRCPRRPFYDNPRWINGMLELHRMYKQGLMPNDGLWLDQPAKFSAMMLCIDTAIEDAQTSKQEIEERRRGSPASARSGAR